jgi:hypothetical protein
MKSKVILCGNIPTILNMMHIDAHVIKKLSELNCKHDSFCFLFVVVVVVALDILNLALRNNFNICI